MLGEGTRVLAANQLGERGMCHPRSGSGGGQVKHVQVEVRVFGCFALDVIQHSLLLLQGEGRLLRQHQHGTPVHIQRAVADHDEILRAVGHTELAQRFHGLRDHSQGLARLGKLPARDGHHAIRLQVLEILAEGLDGVQVVLAEGESSGRGGGPGIHQSHLHHVVPVAAVAHEGAPVADVHVHLGNLVEVVSVVGENPAHDVGGNDGIDLDAGDVQAAVGDGAQHIHSAARADDGEVSARTQHVGHRRCRRHQIATVSLVPVIGIGVHDVGAGVGVDDDCLGVSPPVHFHARERIPLGVERRFALHALGIDDVNELAAKVRYDQYEQGQREDRGNTAGP